ncbi:MAG TPA: D-hexose-6-phosphate mutarotase [Tepidisphaeraceae bacterium]|nr:D-hexose-6-phosphate mutarotase [Tepidisphaeraceae bacterium]
MTQQLSDLQALAIPHTLIFEEGPQGLLRAAIITPHGEAAIYIQGAHVTHYRPTGQKPLLFLSEQSHLEPGKPIRGGVPIVFPWFGPRAGDQSAPAHGFARILPWIVESTHESPDRSITLAFRLDSSDLTRKLWPYDFTARYQVTVGASLDLSLEVQNRSAEAFQFEEALHTYLAVGDVRQTAITGLADTLYLDKTESMARKTQGPDPLGIAGETDRVYLNTRAACFVDDPVIGRRITIEKSGSDTTVVWNPWIAKAKAMADFGDDEWPSMLCIESANALDNAVNLAPGQRHTLQVRYLSEPR